MNKKKPKNPLDQLAKLSPESLEKVLALLEQNESKGSLAKPLEISNKDVVEKKVKTTVKQTMTGRGSATVGKIKPLTGHVIIFTGKEDPKERSRNKKRVKDKNYRPLYEKIKCDSPNCKGGSDNQPFEGSPGLFTEISGQKYCNSCLESKLRR